MTTAQEPLTNAIPPFPFFIENPVVPHRNDLQANKASTNQLPGRCQFTFSDGRQCAMARSDIHPSLCRFHAEREDQLFGDPSPGGYVVGAALDLPELYSACRDLTTAAGVNRALAQVFRLLAQRRISRQEAATFGHLAQLLLRSISAMRQENLTSRLESQQVEQPRNGIVERQKDVAITPFLPQKEVELSPRDKVPSTFVPQPRDPGTPPETPVVPHSGESDDAPSPPRKGYPPAAKVYQQDELSPLDKGALFAGNKAIPNPPSADEGVAAPCVSYNQRAQTPASNSGKMNTCAKPLNNPSKMNTYEIAELKVAHNEHLCKTGEVANAQVPSAGSPAYAAFAHAGVAAGTKQISPVREHWESEH